MTLRPRRHPARRVARFAAGMVALAGLVMVAGCQGVGEPKVTYLGDADLNHYVGRATKVDSPDEPTMADDAVATLPPHTLTDRSRDVVRDMTLAEAISLCLSNSKVIREQGQFLSPTNPLLTNPEFVTSIYDAAIQETGTQFGSRGVEAALSDFDALFTTQMVWGREEQIQNTLFGFGQQPGQTLQQDTARFTSRLEKPFVTGGSFAVSHDVNYEFNNAQSRLFDSVYTGNVQAEFRQPLLAGFGTEFNRIAGPQSRNLGRNVQLTNGVLIARINNDIEIAEFQRAARNLLREVEDAYWNLSLAYRVYDAEVVARDSVTRTWRLVQTRRDQGLSGGTVADEAQARQSLFETRARVEGALADLYQRELELRRITGLPVNDGNVLRPIDEPIVAEFKPDWYAALCEALTSRTELRRQKWQIKSLELQLVAAENLTQPNLDVISRYRVNGFGDKLLSRGDDDVAGTEQGLDSYYNTLLDNDQTGWDVGLELSVPVGLRSARSQVRNFELRVAKARATLATMEHEISHELAAAFQQVDRFHQAAETNLNGRIAAEEQLRAFQAQFDLGGIGGGGEEGGGARPASLDLLLRSQIILAQAEQAYWQSVIQYNQAIADVHLRQGTLLEVNGVSLAEGSWTPQAYEQALRRAWARSHAFKNPLTDTAPDPFALPGEILPTALPPQGLVRPLPDPISGGATVPPPAPVAPATDDPALPSAPPAAPPPAPTPSEPIVDLFGAERDMARHGTVAPAGGYSRIEGGPVPTGRTPGDGQPRLIRGLNR